MGKHSAKKRKAYLHLGPGDKKGRPRTNCGGRGRADRGEQNERTSETAASPPPTKRPRVRAAREEVGFEVRGALKSLSLVAMRSPNLVTLTFN